MGAQTSDIGAVAAPGRERRMTAGRKREAVLRLLRGEPLELVARELRWRDEASALGGGRSKRHAPHTLGASETVYGGRFHPCRGSAAGLPHPAVRIQHHHR